MDFFREGFTDVLCLLKNHKTKFTNLLHSEISEEREFEMRTHVLVLLLLVICAIVYPQKKNQRIIKPKMIKVDGGTFLMGCNDRGTDQRPAHSVTVSSFFIGKYEVTQELWETVMGYNPSKRKVNKNNPVEYVSWFDAIEFCNKLSEIEGLQKAYSRSGEEVICDFNSNGYRLPTEAEWEFAARGGNKSKGYEYSGSNDIYAVAWHTNNSAEKKKNVNVTHPVGTKQANELGIHDMSGNVKEWCWDWYGEYSASSQINPIGEFPGTFRERVSRGGSIFCIKNYCHFAYRNNQKPEGRSTNLGFRLARTKI